MSKVYAKFENKGEIDINAFRLLGASTKEEDESKIGFWGSGLKYALAILLRNNIDIKCYSGNKEIKIGTRKTKMRGETYEVITINGTPTSITTQMGKDWELWFAVREIYSNLLDEGGCGVDVSDMVQGVTGKTSLFIEMTDEIKDIFDNFEYYFGSNREVKYDLGEYKIYNKLRGLIYRMGIKVGQEDNLLYDYEIPDIKINESRVIPSSFYLDQQLSKIWHEEANTEMIGRLVKEDCYEKNNMDWDWSNSFNDNWLTYLTGKTIIPREAAGFFVDDMSKAHFVLPTNICSRLFQQFGNKLNIKGYNDTNQEVFSKEVEISEIEKQRIDGLKNKIGVKFPAIDRMEVIVSKLSVEELGTIIDGKIVLNENILSKGDDIIMETLVEEFIHMSSGADDRTRQFQDYAISMIISLIK